MDKEEIVFIKSGGENQAEEKTFDDIKPNDFNDIVKVRDCSHEDSEHENDLSSEPFPTSRLYSVEEKRGAELENSIRLLKEALSLAEGAFEFFEQGDLFGSEDSMQKIHMLLPELFCCRELGDGFGMIVMALYHAHNGRNDNPYDRAQILEVKHLLRVLLDEPFLPTKLAVERIINLEDCGLEVNPKRMSLEGDDSETEIIEPGNHNE
jgi:hypothetical protein